MTEGIEALNNPVVATGFQVILGGISVQDAIASITSNQFTTVMNDERLGQVLEEAWEWAAERDVENPGAGWVYYLLIVECAKDRLRRIGLLRKAEPGEAADRRMAGWISVTANYMLSLGMMSILRRDLREAFDQLIQAEMIARGLPDLDQPRYPNIVAALIGQIEVARAGNSAAFAQQAEERLAVIAGLPVWRHLPVGEIRESYARLFAARSGVAQQAAASPPPSGSSTAWPSRRARPADMDLMATYQRALYRLGRQVEGGALAQDEAARQLAQVSTPSALAEGHQRLLCDMICDLAQRAPGEALAIARLHGRLAELPDDETAGLRRALASYALGCALLGVQTPRSLEAQSPPMFAEAAAALAASIPPLDAYDDAMAATAMLRLGLAYRGARQADLALQADRDAVRRLQAQPSSPYQRGNLASALGNLGDALELAGEPAEALQRYQQAYREFSQLGDSRNSLRALTDVMSLAGSLGRSDEAAIAARQALVLEEGASDLTQAAYGCLHVAELALRHDQASLATEALNRAERLAWQVPDTPESRDRGWTILMCQIFWYQSFTLVPYLSSADPAGLVPLARALAERSRLAAVDAGHEGRLVQALMLAARVEEAAGDRDAATMRLRQLELVRVPPALEPDVAVAKARAMTALHPTAAIEMLERSARDFATAGRFDNAAVSLITMGEAYEGAGDNAGALSSYTRAEELLQQLRGLLASDTTRIGLRGRFETLYVRLVLLCARDISAGGGPVWYWVERAKGRALVELMGLSPIAPGPEAGRDDTAELLAEEERNLSALRTGRLDQLHVQALEPERDANELDRARLAVEAYARLGDIWAELAPSLPDYVALRTGEVADWRAVQRCLAS